MTDGESEDKDCDEVRGLCARCSLAAQLPIKQLDQTV